MLLADDPQGPLSYANRSADFRQVRPVRMALQKFLEPGENHFVTPTSCRHLRWIALAQAADHGKHELLLYVRVTPGRERISGVVLAS